MTAPFDRQCSHCEGRALEATAGWKEPACKLCVGQMASLNQAFRLCHSLAKPAMAPPGRREVPVVN